MDAKYASPLWSCRFPSLPTASLHVEWCQVCLHSLEPEFTFDSQGNYIKKKNTESMLLDPIPSQLRAKSNSAWQPRGLGTGWAGRILSAPLNHSRQVALNGWSPASSHNVIQPPVMHQNIQ